MDYLDEFLSVFGSVMIADVVKIGLAGAFLIYVGKKFADYLIKRHDAEVEKDNQLKEVLDAVRQYPTYRQQSLNIQHELEDEDKRIRNDLKKVIKRLEEMEERTKKRERNRIRESLLRNYRYFTSKVKNPMQAWTRMEADAFWEEFKDYEEMGGNGHIHTEVKPAMRKLEVVEMNETEKVSELMHSRA